MSWWLAECTKLLGVRTAPRRESAATRRDSRKNARGERIRGIGDRRGQLAATAPFAKYSTHRQREFVGNAVVPLLPVYEDCRE